MTIINEMDVDHGLTVPLSLIFGQPEAWPVQGDPARGQRRAVPAADRQPLLAAGRGHPPRGRELPRGPERPGLGHRRDEPPAPGPARRADQQASSTPQFLDRLTDDPEALRKIPHIEYLREAGSRGDRAGDVADHARRAGRTTSRSCTASTTCRRRNTARRPHRPRAAHPTPDPRRIAMRIALAGAGAFGKSTSTA